MLASPLKTSTMCKWYVSMLPVYGSGQGRWCWSRWEPTSKPTLLSPIAPHNFLTYALFPR